MNALLNPLPPQIQSHPLSPAPPQRPRNGGSRRTRPCLTFSPLAWLKLQFFCHAGETEVGGFGISSPTNLLYIQDFVTLTQKTSLVTVQFDDSAVADHFDAMADRDILPARCGRIWMHTHPGSSADPSFVDEETFERVFGSCDWALMFIIARSGQTYARLRFNTGPGGQVLLPVEIDWAAWPNAVAEHSRERSTPLSQLLELWMDEYGENVWPELDVVRPATAPSTAPTRDLCHSGAGRGTVPTDLDLIPPWEEQAWDDQPWEEDPELSALAQMEDELAFEAHYDNPYTPYPYRRSPLW